MLKVKQIVCLGLIGISSLVFADDAICPNAMKQNDINQCVHGEMLKADKALNTTYSQFLKTLNAQDQQKLKESQRLWIQFKEKDCAFNASFYEGGSMQPMVLDICLMNKAQQRTKELKQLMNELDN